MSIYASMENEVPGLTYLGSHLYPTRADPPAHVGLSHIPAYCVPGREESGLDWPGNGQWLRLHVATVGPHGGEWSHRPMIPPGGTVVLTRKAARALALQLLAWSETPEVKPTPKALAEYVRRRKKAS
jgi:hypothetical protein